jgi:hypothetical protein
MRHFGTQLTSRSIKSNSACVAFLRKQSTHLFIVSPSLQRKLLLLSRNGKTKPTKTIRPKNLNLQRQLLAHSAKLSHQVTNSSLKIVTDLFAVDDVLPMINFTCDFTR